jgi:hypothetical protein
MRRWYGIRHVRFYWHSRRLAYWLSLWHPYGYIVPSQADLDYLDAIWEGKA